ncbi:MAG: DUF3574 domain-containing protein [Pyrinomonadaceae bacterium]
MTKAGLLLFILFALGPSTMGQSAVQPARPPTTAARAEKFYRTELYFGLSKPDGTMVSDDDWKAFLAEVVTPRFPDGFTVLKGMGQYRTKSGRIVSEPSEVVIFLYAGRDKRASRTKIEEIRAAYVKRFDQESVLRVDLAKRVSVFF